MHKPIRVAHIVGKLLAGGVEMVVFNYYRAIDKSKIQFDFYYDADSTVEPPQELINMGARFIKVPPYQHLLNYLSSLRKHFKENNYTVVHSHINTLSVFPLYMAWYCGIPVRIAHNHSVPGGEDIKRIGLKYFLRIFARIFPTDYYACSEKAGRWLFGDKNYEKGKVTVIRNAVDFDRFRSEKSKLSSIRYSLGISDKLVIGHVGRFTFAKNHKFLIELFSQIVKKKDAVLMLVGDGELNEQIHQWVNDYGVADKVVFIGKVTNPEMYYRLSNVIVIPSIFEGLSLSTIESQIAGTPVVASEAIPEEAIISDGCIRLSLKDNNWVDTILKYASREVHLDDRSKAYNISYASMDLENKYLTKVGECYAKSICNNGNIQL